jgi:hydroxybutyrate-dimer hydrolase
LVTSPSTGRQDLNLDSALCFRALQDGPGPDASARDWLNFAQVRFGTRQVQTNARVHGRPAIVIHGRQDALVFPNLHSRAYYALNQEREGRKSRMSYIEVTPGQHFDAFISSFFLGPAGAQFAPLHYYFVVAMDAMYAHLTSGTALPPSQVVRPTPRGLTPYTPADAGTRLPNPSNAPGSNAIRFDHGVLTIPE